MTAASSALVVMTWRRLGPTGQRATPCSTDSNQPLAWRVLLLPLSAGRPAGAQRVIDQGVNRLVFEPPGFGEYCTGPLIPRVVGAGGQIAYAVESLSAATPAGARITIRRLSDGRVTRTVATANQVVSLALSKTSVAWSESENTMTTSHPSWAVRRLALANGRCGGGGARSSLHRPGSVHRRWLSTVTT